MGCNDLKPPSPPTLESLPSNVNLPSGMSADSLKNMASGKGLSDAMNNVGGLIGGNLKKLGSALSPAAIGDRIGAAVDSIAGGIADRVNSAVDGLSNLKNQLKSADPSAILEKLPGSPDSVRANIQSRITGSLDFGNIQGTININKCAETFTKQAGEVNKQLSDSVAAAAGNIPGKDKIKMSQDAEFKQAKEQEIVDTVKQQTASSAQQTTQSPDKDNKTAQDKIQSEVLKTETISKPRTGKAYIDYMLIGPVEGWELYNKYPDADRPFRFSDANQFIFRSKKLLRPTTYDECAGDLCTNSSLSRIEWSDDATAMNKIYSNHAPKTTDLTDKWEEYLLNNFSDSMTLYMLYVETKTTKYEFDRKATARVPKRVVWNAEEPTFPGYEIITVINNHITIETTVKLWYTVPPNISDDTVGVNWDYVETTGEYEWLYKNIDDKSAYKTAVSRGLSTAAFENNDLKIYTRNEDI